MLRTPTGGWSTAASGLIGEPDKTKPHKPEGKAEEPAEVTTPRRKVPIEQKTLDTLFSAKGGQDKPADPETAAEKEGPRDEEAGSSSLNPYLEESPHTPVVRTGLENEDQTSRAGAMTPSSVTEHHSSTHDAPYHSLASSEAETEFDKMSSVSARSSASRLSKRDCEAIARNTLTELMGKVGEEERNSLRQVLSLLSIPTRIAASDEESLLDFEDLLVRGEEEARPAPTHPMTTRSKAKELLNRRMMQDEGHGELDSAVPPAIRESNLDLPTGETVQDPNVPGPSTNPPGLPPLIQTPTRIFGRGRPVTSTPKPGVVIRGRGITPIVNIVVPPPPPPVPAPAPVPPAPDNEEENFGRNGSAANNIADRLEALHLQPNPEVPHDEDNRDQAPLAPNVQAGRANRAYRPPNAAVPVLNPDVEPMPGPEFVKHRGDPAAAQMGADGKLGDQCVVTRSNVPTIANLNHDLAQNIIRGLHPVMKGAENNVVIGQNTMELCYRWILPRKAEQLHQSSATTVFTRFHRNMFRSPNWLIQWDDPRIKGQVPPEVMNSYVPDRVVNFKLISSVLRGVLRVSNEVCNALCTTPIQNTYKFNLDGLFTVGHIAADFLWWLERDNINHVLGVVRADAVVVVDVTAVAAAAPAQITMIERLNQERRIVLPREALTAMDFNVLQLLAQGVNYIHLQNNAVRFVHQLMHSEAIYFAVYQEGVAAIPQPALPTCSDVIASMRRIARLLQAEDDYVRGYVRAHSLINGKVHATETQTQYISAGLEIERVRMSKPVGASLVWTMLSNRWDNVDNEADLFEEYRELEAMPYSVSMRVGSVIAGMYGLGVSSSLHRVNMGGRCLNVWGRRVAGDVTSALDHITEADVATGAPTLVRSAASLVTSMSGYVLSWRAFRMSSWCGGLRHLNQVCPNHRYWSQIWARYVPYVVRPESLGWALSSLLSVWGLTGLFPNLHIDSEIIEGVIPNMQLLATFKGDSTWEVIANSNQPFMYFEYPVHVLNVLYQHLRWPVVVPVSFRTYTTGVAGQVFPDVAYYEGDDFQPQFDGETRSIIPGTLLSYSWEHDRFLGACLRRLRMDPAYWLQLSTMKPIEAACAGMELRRPAEKTHVPPRRINLRNILGGGEGEAAAATAPTGQENREN
uniref:Capsid protein n=1 Tax=Stinn virus TaxID=2800944 RepID=A0A894KPF0_9VIRU|nr:MAG: capsid protein [Stinn virus]